MHPQCARTHRKAQALAFQWLAIKIDVEPFRDLDLDPWQARADKHVVDAPTVHQQVLERPHDILRCREDADIQQAVVDQRLRT